MLSIRIICVGKLKEKYYTDAVNEYLKRLSGYCKPEIVEIAEHASQANNALDKERADIEARIPAGAMVVALCVEGIAQDSKEFSQMLSEFAVKGISRLCFIIGGSRGLHDEIKAKAGIKLSLSKMTFPHHLARVILLEQLYRALNIESGGKYHK